MALTLGGAGADDGIHYGFPSPKYNPVTGRYETTAGGSGLVFVGSDPSLDTRANHIKAYLYYLSMFQRAQVSTLNQQPSLEEIQKNLSAENRAIPIVYGAAQVGGSIFAINYNVSTKTWTIGYSLCLGEINSIGDVWINGELPVSGVLIDKYTGTTGQTVNSKLSTAIAGFTDTMVITHPQGNVGVAYIVVQYKDSHYDDWPQVVAEIQGKKVWNPTTSTTVYSTNPALHLADLLASAHYGYGYAVDNASLITAQNYCDDATPGEVRRTSYSVIDKPMDTSQWVEILRGYASCFLTFRGNTVHFIPDKPGISVMTITADDILAGTMQITKKDSSDLPTVIRCSYTDTSGDIWRERLCTPVKAAGVDAGTTPWRESRFSMVGINRHSQAVRECTERLNVASQIDMEATWEMFDEALALEVGDIVTVTHPYGLTAKTMRIDRLPEQLEPGRWRITATEYSAAVYSDAIVTDSPPPDAVLPSGIVPAPPTDLVLTENLYQMQNGQYSTRLNITWVAPTNSLVTGYSVKVTEGNGGPVVFAINTADTETATGPLKEGSTYYVYVSAYNNLYSSSAISQNELIDGKSDIPAPPTGLSGSNTNGDVRLSWTGSVDADVLLYEVRYYTTAQSWAAGTVLDRTASLTFTTREAAAGSTWRFGVKSLDTTGHYSATAAEVDVPVSLSTSGVTTFVSDDIPTALAAGDLWFESDMNNRLFYATAPGTANWVLAQDASGAVEGKVSTFVAGTPPTSTAIGDLWINSADNNKLYRAASIGATTIAAGQWVSMRDAGIDSAQATADGKVDTWFASSDPGVKPEGDLWINTTNNQIKIYKTGTGWVDLTSATVAAAAAAAAAADAKADGKVTTYYTGTTPTSEAIGDLWINTSDGNKLYRAAIAGADQIIAGEWESARDLTIAITTTSATAPSSPKAGDVWLKPVTGGTELYIRNAGNTAWTLITDPGIATAISDAADAQATADGKIFTYVSTTAPTGLTASDVGDLWIHTDSTPANQLSRWSGSAWVLVRDGGIDEAYNLADGKITSFYQTNAPTVAEVGDIWVDTTGGLNVLKYCTSIGPVTWTSVQDSATALAVANSKNTVYYADGPTGPTGADQGDVWYDTADGNQQYRYNSGSWVLLNPTKLLRQRDVFASTTTSNITAVAGERYAINTTSNVVNLTLPVNPLVNDRVGFYDSNGKFDLYNLIIKRAASGENIFGAAEDMTVGIRWASLSLEYVGGTAGWVIS